MALKQLVGSAYHGCLIKFVQPPKFGWLFLITSTHCSIFSWFSTTGELWMLSAAGNRLTTVNNSTEHKELKIAINQSKIIKATPPESPLSWPNELLVTSSFLTLQNYKRLLHCLLGPAVNHSKAIAVLRGAGNNNKKGTCNTNKPT